MKNKPSPQVLMVYRVCSCTHLFMFAVPPAFSADLMLVDVWNWFVLCVVTLLCQLFICASTLHLLSFHVMLKFNHMTTFSYIVQQRQKRRVRFGFGVWILGRYR